MYVVKLVYDPEPYSVQLKESITYSVSVQLFLRGIHCAQTSASRLAFDTDQDRVRAVLILGASSRYRVICE